MDGGGDEGGAAGGVVAVPGRAAGASCADADADQPTAPTASTAIQIRIVRVS
jgi:hypothetical protein